MDFTMRQSYPDVNYKSCVDFVQIVSSTLIPRCEVLQAPQTAQRKVDSICSKLACALEMS